MQQCAYEMHKQKVFEFVQYRKVRTKERKPKKTSYLFDSRRASLLTIKKNVRLLNLQKIIFKEVLLLSLGVVNSKKLSRSELFSTDFGPKVTDRPRIFPAGSIWSCTVAWNLKNATCLCCSKFNRNKITF